MCEVVATSISAIWDDPNFEALIEEYAQESAIKGLPHPNAKRESYEHLYSVGVMHPWAAYKDRRLIGFIGLLLPVVPHYSEVIGTTESYFVASKYRNTGAGLRLLKAVEQKCKEVGAKGLLVSSPSGGRLAEVMPRLGYAESNVVFFKGFDDGSTGNR